MIDPSKTSPLLLHLRDRFGMTRVFGNPRPGSAEVVSGPWRPESSDPDVRWGFAPGVEAQIPAGGAPHGGVTNAIEEGVDLANHPSNPLRLPDHLHGASSDVLWPDRDLAKRDLSFVGRGVGRGMANQFLDDMWREVFGAMVLTLSPRTPVEGTEATLSIRNAGPGWLPIISERWVARRGQPVLEQAEYAAPSSSFAVTVPVGAREGFISATPPGEIDKALGAHTGDIKVLPAEEDPAPNPDPEPDPSPEPQPDPVPDPEPEPQPESDPTPDGRPSPEERSEELIRTIHYLLRPESDLGQLVRHFLAMLIAWKRRSE